MTGKSHEIEQAVWELKKLTASDPQAAANMMRHAAATALLLTGRRQIDNAPGEPIIVACFAPCLRERAFLSRITAETGSDQVLVTFDVDDAAGPPIGLALIRREDDAVSYYETCQLWSPADAGRAILVPTGTQDFGHFVFRRGSPPRHAPGRPARNLEAGFRRARGRFAANLESQPVRSAGREGWLHLLGSDAGKLTSSASRIAA